MGTHVWLTGTGAVAGSGVHGVCGPTGDTRDPALCSQLEESKRAWSFEKEGLEADARRARLEAAARVRTLEDAVKALSSRGDPQLEIERLCREMDAVRRSEARLQDELAMARQQGARLAADLRDAEAQLAALRARDEESAALDAAVRAAEGRAGTAGPVAAAGDALAVVRQLQRDREEDRARHAAEVARLRARAEDAERQEKEAKAGRGAAERGGGGVPRPSPAVRIGVRGAWRLWRRRWKRRSWRPRV